MPLSVSAETGSDADKSASPVTTNQPRKLAALTSLRFVAAVMVVLAHFRYTFWPAGSLGAFDDFGQVVSFFFILSGFMLTYAYPDLKLNDGGKFVLRRISRLWPLHAVMLGMTFLLIPKIAEQTMKLPDAWLILLANISMVQAWVPVQSYFFSFNIVTWYLSSLFGMILCFPLLIQGFSRNWPLKLAGAFLLTMTLLFCSQTLPLFTEKGLSGQGLTFISPLSRMFEFVLGMSAAIWFRKLDAGWLRDENLGTLLEAFALLLAIGVMAIARDGSAALEIILGKQVAYYLNFAGFTLLPFTVLILALALGRGRISRWLGHPLAVRLGEISFGVYMIHVTLIHWYLYPVALKPHAPQPDVVKMILFWIMLLGLSYCSWRFLERPYFPRLRLWVR